MALLKRVLRSLAPIFSPQPATSAAAASLSDEDVRRAALALCHPLYARAKATHHVECRPSLLGDHAGEGVFLGGRDVDAGVVLALFPGVYFPGLPMHVNIDAIIPGVNDAAAIFEMQNQERIKLEQADETELRAD